MDLRCTRRSLLLQLKPNMPQDEILRAWTYCLVYSKRSRQYNSCRIFATTILAINRTTIATIALEKGFPANCSKRD